MYHVLVWAGTDGGTLTCVQGRTWGFWQFAAHYSAKSASFAVPAPLLTGALPGGLCCSDTGAKVRGSEAAAVLQGMLRTPGPALVLNGEEGLASSSPSQQARQEEQRGGQGEEQLGDGNEGFSGGCC